MAKCFLPLDQLELICLSAVRRELGPVLAITLNAVPALESAGNWELATIDPIQSHHAFLLASEILRGFQKIFALELRPSPLITASSAVPEMQNFPIRVGRIPEAARGTILPPTRVFERQMRQGRFRTGTHRTH